jgi:hypothetical protein
MAVFAVIYISIILLYCIVHWVYFHWGDVMKKVTTIISKKARLLHEYGNKVQEAKSALLYDSRPNNIYNVFQILDEMEKMYKDAIGNQVAQDSKRLNKG